MTRRRCCCGGVAGCPSCYYANANTHDCSVCDTGDTATIDFNVSFTPYQYGAVEDYSGTIGPFGFASEFAFTDFCVNSECTDFGIEFRDSFNSYPNPPKSAEKVCLNCDGSYFSSGNIYFENCCPCDFSYFDPSSGFDLPCYCPTVEFTPCDQIPGPCNCNYPFYTNQQLQSMCPGIRYNFIDCSGWIDSYCNNPNISVSCGFKPARYTLIDDVARTILLNGYYKTADIDNTGAGTMQIVTPGLSKKEQNRKVVFKRKAGKICGVGDSGNQCGFVAVEDIGSGYPLGSTLQENIPLGIVLGSLGAAGLASDYRLQAAAVYLPCIRVSPTSDIPSFPVGSGSKYNHLITCESQEYCNPPGPYDESKKSSIIVISGTTSGNTACKEFYDYVNPENDPCKRYSMILVATGFTHSAPPNKPINFNGSSTYPCGTFWSSIIGTTFSTDVRHADTLLYYYRELPDCSIIENNNYCFNKGIYKLGYVRFGYTQAVYEYPYDPDRSFYKSSVVNNRIYGNKTFSQGNLGYSISNYPGAESNARRAYICYPGQNGPDQNLIPGEMQGIPTDPNLRTDFEYPNEITLL